MCLCVCRYYKGELGTRVVDAHAQFAVDACDRADDFALFNTALTAAEVTAICEFRLWLRGCRVSLLLFLSRQGRLQHGSLPTLRLRLLKPVLTARGSESCAVR
jgi:hypothetical protein